MDGEGYFEGRGIVVKTIKKGIAVEGHGNSLT